MRATGTAVLLAILAVTGCGPVWLAAAGAGAIAGASSAGHGGSGATGAPSLPQFFVQPADGTDLTSLGPARVAQSYSIGIVVQSEGDRFTLTAVGLPPGLLFFAEPTPYPTAMIAQLSGTPTQDGVFDFGIDVTDYFRQITVTHLHYTLTIAAGAFLQLTPSAAPAATVDGAYSMTLTAAGGTAPYNFTTAGVLPNGIALVPSTVSGQALLIGTPLIAGLYAFSVSVTDSQANSTSLNYSITVN